MRYRSDQSKSTHVMKITFKNSYLSIQNTEEESGAPNFLNIARKREACSDHVVSLLEMTF